MRIVAILAAIAVSACATEAQQSSQAKSSAPESRDAFLRGSTSYWLFCMSCHEPAKAGAPDRAALQTMSADAIYKKLSGGATKHVADLPQGDDRYVANYLGRK